MTACRPVRSFSKVAQQVGIKDEGGQHSVLPYSAIPCHPLSPLTRIYLKLWSLSFFLTMAVLNSQERGRTAFCHPAQLLSQVARQVGMKDKDRLRFSVLSRPGLLAVPLPGPVFSTVWGPSRAPKGTTKCWKCCSAC